jgi:hypothetical protein
MAGREHLTLCDLVNVYLIPFQVWTYKAPANHSFYDLCANACVSIMLVRVLFESCYLATYV